jgi:hypothetical protein
MSVLVKIATSERLLSMRPQLFEWSLELLYYLAAAPETGEAMLNLLRASHGMLISQVDLVGCSALPPEVRHCVGRPDPGLVALWRCRVVLWGVVGLSDLTLVNLRVRV